MSSDAIIGDTRFIQAGGNTQTVRDYDAEFGGPEERRRLEKKLLRKIDARMSILVIIYILNYVSLHVKLMWLGVSSVLFKAGNWVALKIARKAH